MNCWNGIGNIGDDPTMRHTGSGRPVLNFKIAVDRISKVDTPQGPIVQKVPDWIPIVVFGDAATHNHKYLQKGSKIAVSGTLRNRSFIDNHGVSHSTFEIHAERIDWLDHIKSTMEVVTL